MASRKYSKNITLGLKKKKDEKTKRKNRKVVQAKVTYEQYVAIAKRSMIKEQGDDEYKPRNVIFEYDYVLKKLYIVYIVCPVIDGQQQPPA